MMILATQSQQQQEKWNTTKSYRDWRSRKHDLLKFQIATFLANKYLNEALARDSVDDPQAESPRKRKDTGSYLEECTRPNSR